MTSVSRKPNTRAKSPVIGATRATFRWSGSDPPEIIGDFNGWGLRRRPLTFRLAGPGEWQATIRLTSDAYIEYAFSRNGMRIPDPLNPVRRSDGVGHFTNSFAMPEWSPSPLLRPRNDIATGTVSKHEVRNDALVVGGKRTVWIYEPPLRGASSLRKPAGAPLPVLIVLDGQDYLRRGRLTTIVDNLIAGGRMAPIVMGLIAHGRRARVVEYGCNDVTAGFIVKEVIPLIQRHCRLPKTDSRAGLDYGILGASMGGLMALHMGICFPEIFGSVLSQSGAFRLEALFGRSLLEKLIPCLPPPKVTIWMDVGRYEGLLEANRRQHRALLHRGYDVTYREFSGGHNWTAWRNDVAHGLEALFPATDVSELADVGLH